MASPIWSGPRHLREALRFFLERAGNRSTRQIHALATAALAIARHWVRVDDAQEQTLRGLARRCDPGAGGMTEKNRAVLRQLEDPERVHKLLVLPDRLARGLARKPVLTRPEALRLQTALAIAILIAAPIRISNLAATRARPPSAASRPGRRPAGASPSARGARSRTARSSSMPCRPG